MKLFEKIKKWWKNNQEKDSERYQEREELKKELEEYSKDIKMFIESPVYKINDLPLQKYILIQNLHTQRKLNLATNGLKIATWILALATTIFAWVAIKDSPNSNEIMQTLQGIAIILIYFIIFGIAITLLWNIGKFIIKFFTKR